MKPKKNAASQQEPLVMVETTVASPQDARRLAGTVLTEKLAACAQITAITSHYLWQEREVEEKEYAIRFKTRRCLWPAISGYLQQHHPYDLPQIVLVPIEAVSEDYQSWVIETTKAL